MFERKNTFKMNYFIYMHPIYTIIVTNFFVINKHYHDLYKIEIQNFAFRAET